jgi:hypothetical protein
MENRNGLLIEFTVEPAAGYAERKSARAMLETRECRKFRVREPYNEAG